MTNQSSKIPPQRLYSLIEQLTTEEKDILKVLIPDGENGVKWSDSTGLTVDWSKITGDINTNTDLPFNVSGTENKDAFFLGDITAFGEILAQGNSLIISNTISIGGSNNLLLYEDMLHNQQATFALNRITNKVSDGVKYVDYYFPFTHTDPFGQQQPDDSETFNSIPFVDSLTGENKYYMNLVLSSQFAGVTYEWFVRSLTGLTNAYFRAWIGIELDPNAVKPNWKTNTDKDIINKENLVNNVGGAGVDIPFKLGKSYFQEFGADLSFILIADNNFTMQGATLPAPPPYSAEIPYVTADGNLWRESPITSRTNPYSFSKDYLFDTDVADTDPTTGKFKFNNADISLATFLYIHKEAIDLVDNNSVIDALTVNSCVMIEDLLDTGNRVKWTVITTPVLSGDYYKVEGSSSSINGSFTLDLKLIATFFLIGGGDTVKFIDFEPQSPVPSHKEGRVYYNAERDTLDFYNAVSDVAINLPEEIPVRIFNNSGATIVNGSLIRVNGVSGGLPTIILSQADTVENASVLGAATHDIENNTVGYITAFGYVGSLDTSSFNAGDTLFLSESIAGGYTNIEQQILNPVALVLVSDVSDGVVFIRPRGIVNLTAFGQMIGGFGETQSVSSTPSKLAVYTGTALDKNVTAILTGADPFEVEMHPASIGASGFYEVSFSVAMSSTGNNLFIFEMYINGAGSALVGAVDLSNNNTDAGSTSFSVITPVSIDNTDQVEIYVYSDGGSPTITVESVVFNLKRIGNV